MKLLPLITVLLLVGCAPIPHTDQVTPRIEGRVLIDGKPEIGVEVRLSQSLRTSACEVSEYTALTNEYGNFIFEPINEFKWFVDFTGDRIYVWNLCVINDGVRYTGFEGLSTGYLPEREVLVCSITSKSTPYSPSNTGAELYSIQVCNYENT